MTTPTRLFSRILSLAIQGKLVSNHADDTVDDLLKEIAANNSARKKSKSDPISDDQIPFQIPDNWKWVRLGEIISIKSGDNLTSKQMQEGNIPVYGGNGINGYHSEYNVEESTIVIGRVGFYCGSIHITSEKAWVTDNAFITSFPKEFINKEFLVYVLKYLDLRKTSSSTAQPVVSGKSIYPLPFPLPPLSIQSRIVSKLNEIKALVDECEDIENGLEKDCELLRKKVLDLALRGHLTTQLPSDGDAQSLIDQIEAEKAKSSAKNKKYIPPQPVNPDDAPFQIPDNWKWVRLGEIKDIWSAKRVMKEDWKSIGVPFYRAREITKLSKNEPVIDDLFITEELYNELKSKYGIPQKGDIMLSAVGTIGKAYVVKEHDKFYFKDASVICLSSNNDIISSDYMKLLFDTPFMDNQMHENSFGTTVDTITISTALTYLIPLPPLAEQQRIVDKIEEVFAQIDNLRL